MVARARGYPYNSTMTPLDFTLSLGLIAVAAGLLGSLVGLGGGIIIVPVLTLLYGIDIRLAIGASIVSVIATSSGAAAAYVRDRMANIRTGMFLEVGTTVGAISGAFLTTILPTRMLFIIFAATLAYVAFTMLTTKRDATILATSDDLIANRLRLHGSYYDKAEHRTITYKVIGTKIGLVCMYIAGVVSALLGVGSGALKVPAMDLAMHLPIKVSTATSNFMIGVTAAASAGVYLARGQINPFIAAPVALGVLIGAIIGSRLLGRIMPKSVQTLFVIILIVISLEMLSRGVMG